MSLATSTSIPTLVFAAFTAVTLAGCGITVTVDADGDTTSRTDARTLSADGIRALDVDTDNGAVEVRGGAVDEITIQSILREHHDGDATATVDIDGDRLVLVGECDGRVWDACSVGFVVTVPSAIDVQVTTDNGRVATTEIDGDVTIETDNGAIEATAMGGGNVVAETDNGRVRLEFVEAPSSVRTHTDNGSILVRLPDDDRYDVDADSDNGDVDIDVHTDPDAERHVVARSDNGSIDIEYRTT